MDDSVSKQLRKMILENGLTLLKDASHFETVLRERCAEKRKEILALMGAFHEGIVDSLLNSLEPGAAALSTSAMVKDLEENHGLAHGLAEWAIEAWAFALGVKLPAAEAVSPSQISSSRLASDQRPVAVQEKKKQVKKTPARQRWMMAGGFALAACGIIFWSFAPSGSDSAASKGGSSEVGPSAAKSEAAASADHHAESASVKPEAAPTTVAPVSAATNEAARPVVTSLEVKEEPASSGLAKQPVVHQPVHVVIPKGTAVSIQLGEEVDSSAASPGDRIKSSVAASVSVAGTVAIPHGAHAVVEVASVKKAGRVRGSSELRLQLVEVVVHGEKYPLTSQAYDLKAGGFGRVFEKGKGVSIPANERLEFSLNDPVQISTR